MIPVVLENLVKRFDRVAVIDHLSLDLPPGELTYIAGPAGAGKSTLSRLLAGLEPLDDGEIYLDGRAVHTLPPHERKILTITPEPSLWPDRPVHENIAYGLRIQGLSRKQRIARTAEVASLLHLDGLAASSVTDLTPLQRKRVELARAIAVGPSLLVLREPAAGLEGPARDDLHDDLRRLHLEAEISILVLTSDPAEALSQADRLALLDLGRLVQVGPPATLYNHPVDTFAARFLGPVNLVQGHVEPGGGRNDLIVRTPLGRLVALATDRPPQGAPVTLAIRPESISLGPGVPPGANRFPATVERQVFRGPTRLIHLRGPSEWPILALTLQAQGETLREGQVLTAAIPPALVVLLTPRSNPLPHERTAPDASA